MAIPEKDHFAYFEDQKIRWYKCILSRGDYIEADKINLHIDLNLNISIYKQIHPTFCPQ